MSKSWLLAVTVVGGKHIGIRVAKTVKKGVSS